MTDLPAHPTLPRPIRQGLGLAIFPLVLLLLLAVTAVDDPLLGSGLGALAFLLMGFAVDLENMAQARRRVVAYHGLGIPIPRSLAAGVSWRVGPGLGLTAVVAGYFIVGGLTNTGLLPDWVLLPALLTLVGAPFVTAYFVFRRLAQLREAEARAFAGQSGLLLSEEGRGQDRMFILEGTNDGRQVQCTQTSRSISASVLVEHTGGVGLGLQPASWRYRRAARLAGTLVSTGDVAYDRHFLMWSEPAERGRQLFVDPELRQTLLLLNEVSPLFLVAGDDSLWIEQNYPLADAGYLTKLLATAVQCARRLDGHVALEVSGE